MLQLNNQNPGVVGRSACKHVVANLDKSCKDVSFLANCFSFQKAFTIYINGTFGSASKVIVKNLQFVRIHNSDRKFTIG